MASYNTKKIDLFDIETQQIYTLYLSTEDAHKARNDMNFASSLLKYAKENISDPDTPSTSTTKVTENVISHTTYIDNNTDNIECSNTVTQKSNNEDVYLWNQKETLLLLSLCKENEEIFHSGKMKQHSCWEQISREMANKGYNISAKKCCTKFQTLKRTYKQIKDHNNKSGNSRKTWEYLDAMDEFFGTKPWIEPVSTASSDQNNEPAELGPARRNKDKMHSLTWKQSLLEYRKLRATKKDEQHKEKMDLLRDIKNLIQDTLQKE